MSRRMITACAVFLATLVGSLAVGGPAALAQGADGSRRTFAAQVANAGLTAAQAEQLQNKVDGYLAGFGGVQVSANKIDLNGLGAIVVAVPGERYAHDLAEPQSVGTLDVCHYRYFCLYRGTGYTGDQLDLYHCQTYSLSSWVGEGSYINNQTFGTVAHLMDYHHVTITYSGAYDPDPYYNWNPIWFIKPC